MSRLVRLAAAAAAIALTLCACDVLFMGAFNSDLAQATAWRDLSAEVDAAAAPSFQLAIVQAEDAGELVVLFSSLTFDASQNHLYVLTPDLDVLSSFTLDDIAALDPEGVGFSGNEALWHRADGTVVIGNVVAQPEPGGITLLRKLSKPSNLVDAVLRDGAIEGPASADFTWSQFRMSSSQTVTYMAYSADWSSEAPLSLQTGRDSMWFRGVLSNPVSAKSNSAILVFGAGGSSDTTVISTVPKDPDLANGLFGKPLSSYPSIEKEWLDASSVDATSDGLVGYDGHAKAWIWFSPSAPDVVKKLPARNRDSGTPIAFSFSNGWYCVWNPGTRTLIRYEKWW
jgi:hypothetical protein